MFDVVPEHPLPHRKGSIQLYASACICEISLFHRIQVVDLLEFFDLGLSIYH